MAVAMDNHQEIPITEHSSSLFLQQSSCYSNHVGPAGDAPYIRRKVK
jgi:hypothetical protein